MKHVAQRKASPIKPKTETPVQAIVVEKTPAAEKKISNKVNLKTSPPEKSAPKIESSAELTAPKIKAKNNKISLPVVSANQPKSAVKKPQAELTPAGTSVAKKTLKTIVTAADSATPQKEKKTAIDFKKPKEAALKNKPAESAAPIAAEEKIAEMVEPKRAAKPKVKKAKPISSAIFRGKKARYEFNVFAINELFEPIPAVYIISRRKTDKSKRSHHALICIGETTSIFDEIKRHQKSKCVKNHGANVVSILPEADEKIRLKIETDLKAAHSHTCGLD